MSLKIQKIAIIGCTGAGKTTLAKKLGVRFDVPVYHLDHYYWKPGWIESDLEMFKKKHQELITQSAWIIDGNQMATVAERVQTADIIIFLDIPRFICIWRVLRRWLKNALFNTQDSQSTITWGLLCYAWRYNREYRPIVLDHIAKELDASNKTLFMVDSSEKLIEIEEKIAKLMLNH